MTRKRQAVLAAVVVGAVLTSGLVLAVLAEEGRGPTGILDAFVRQGDRGLAPTVDTCTGSPEAEIVSEDDAQVVVPVVIDNGSGSASAAPPA